MKRLLILCFLSFSALPALAQGEADNWYFGQKAGIRFLPDGTVVPLNGGQIATTEGCSTISDADGNLLFYTDGRNVWDRNHLKMPNGNYDTGTGLHGDPSSTQSGIIIPNPANPNLYYIFTVDEPHHDNAAVWPNQFNGVYSDQNGTVPAADDGFNNGFKYSIVDLSVTGANGSIGNITIRNRSLTTYNTLSTEEQKYKCSEKITAVKTADGNGYWVITHFIDKFYAFKVDAAGVNEAPVVTTIIPVVPISGYRRNSIGYLKASPDGTKLAIAHNQVGTQTGQVSQNGVVYLYDFNNATGVVSNAVKITDTNSAYGIEFSRETKKLYVTNQGSVLQFNLEAANISLSKVTIVNDGQSGAIQLGPNGKIYRTVNGGLALDVINNPEADGALCDYQSAAQPIGGPPDATCTLGLPPFITSVFSVSIQVVNTCLGDQTNLSLNVNTAFDTVKWNFGDGTPETAELTVPAITHVYAQPGNYTVTATVTKDGTTKTSTKDITITTFPVANAPQNLVECDSDNNSSATFDLTVNTPLILGSQSSTLYEVKYYNSQANADADTSALAANAYMNTLNPQTIYARVQSKVNPACYVTTSFTVTAANTAVVGSDEFTLCDDAADGDDSNGRTTFNLSQVSQALVINNTLFTTRYYVSLADAQAEINTLANNFYNTVPDRETVFARITNTAFPACSAIVEIHLNVSPLPPAVTGASLTQCDLSVTPDGLTQFNLSEADGQLTGGISGLSVTYFANSADAQNNTAPLPLLFSNTTNPQQITARVGNAQSGCFRLVPLQLIVSANTTTPIVLETCDDDGTEDGFTQFNLREAGIENGANTVTYFATANDALLEQNAVTADFTNTLPIQQNVYARIETNNACTALQEIRLFVRRLPDIDITGEALVCLNTRQPVTLDAGVAGNNPSFEYEWSTGATTRTIGVTQPGTYTVTVTSTANAARCSRTRTITVTASDVAVITDVDIQDLRNNNIVTVYAAPANNVATEYLYSIDLPDGPYGPSNVFENVSPGIHTVYVYDTNGCGVTAKEIAVLGIPKFFTPNGDGVNDTWNIIGVNALFYRDSKIYVFDRFGKLLADIDPRGQGWTGLYNGTPLPATDYWYVVQLDNGRTVKGHFSLMR
ncbi:hypothetical protein CHU92_08510 [Flavobacterium cyanobacteriorum]|uniref:PKD domain-containing protein n=1 Tax=Flavobacterium cyanobacteriorum TaxID=2022802 RepID=A0A255Z702_9FLAO|nr:T9SS type B sorting domain-containing protein [Flavobacterium cyanobacteriorum]OYQ37327.1 hypothetical protein CHU92_08510 [Flavobacterium cyanobacteriorum]